mmetsp:Transcript_15805/g.34350  ORF Transcript_15805/g.34350 Transcript_15805/m.34350 type:complete len:207 (-) Transcript_15805:685-1305(-)
MHHNKNSCFISILPSSLAQLLGESPSTSSWSGSAPASSNSFTVSIQPPMTAACNTDMPSLSTEFASAPLSSSILTQSAAPLSAAKCNAVCPVSSASAMSVPDSIASLSLALFPSMAAAINARFLGVVCKVATSAAISSSLSSPVTDTPASVLCRNPIPRTSTSSSSMLSPFLSSVAISSSSDDLYSSSSVYTISALSLSPWTGIGP